MRDRDVRNAIQAALVATNSFDGVHVWGIPEDYGSGSSERAAVWIVPQSSRQEDLWDTATVGGLVITSRIGLLLVYRHDDPQLRDEGAELLLDTAANALNGNGLPDQLGNNMVFVQTARITGWDWQPPASAERRIQAIYSYQYNVEGWDNYDVNP
jgi:hypothetical protein